jgi:hypothetical protein
MHFLLNRPYILLILANVIILVFIEVVIRLLAYYGHIQIKHYPASTAQILGDINPHFGVWHYSNKNVEHEGACYKINIATNSYGARDQERTLKANNKRVVVLGDSFVEGFGVDTDKRLTEIAEEKTQIDFLNFGTSGDFSSTQEYLLYREFAAKFDHNAVAIFFLPNNDFKDNNPKYFDANRYRPYLKENDTGDFEIYYTVKFEERVMPKNMSTWRSIRRTLYNNIYLVNLLRQIGDLIESSKIKSNIRGSFLELTESSYDEFSEDDLKKLLWGYDKIIKTANSKPVSIFVIPRELDLQLAQNNSQQQKLISELNNFAKKYENVSVIDLTPFFIKKIKESKYDLQDIFLPCDGHWSELGHSIAAEALMVNYN